MKKLALILAVLLISVSASARTPVIPASWTVSAWFIDPANSTGVASDSNTCTTAGTPCLTWGEIGARFGCSGGLACPRLRQSTTFTFLSSHTDNTDPVYVRMADENQAIIQFVGNLGASQQVCSGTLGTVTPKVRTKGSATLLSAATLAGGCTTVAAGQLVVNSTHASRAWVYSGTTAPVFTQPMVQAVAPTLGFPAEVDTWATGDTITVYTPPAADFVEITPAVADINSGGTSAAVYVVNMTGLNPSSGASTLRTNSAVRFMESNMQRDVSTLGNESESFGANGWPNDFFARNVQVNTYDSLVLMGGTAKGVARGSVGLDNDVCIAVGASITAGFYKNIMSLGLIYVDTGATIQIQGAPVDARPTVQNSAAAFWWGPGNVLITANSRVRYNVGATGATLLWIQNGTFQINGQSLFCSLLPGNAATTQVCNLAFTPATLDATFGATNGCALAGGASVCNFGP